MHNDEYTLLKEACAYLKNDRTDDAALLYQKIGELFVRKNELPKAIAAYQKALSLKPNSEDYLSLAMVYEKSGHSYLAFEAYRGAFLVLLDHEQWDIALDIGQKMTTLEPTLLFPYEKRAEIYFTLGHYPQTASEYVKASQIALDHHQAQRALELLYRAFKITPSDKNIWKKLHELIVSHDPQDPLGEKLFLLFHSEKPKTDWSVKLQDAKLLVEENLFLDAKKIYHEILSMDPDQKDARQGLLDLQKKLPVATKTESSSQEVLEALERDLNLHQARLPNTFRLKMEKQELSQEDTIDLAIAYKEMSFPSEAISLLKPLLTKSTGTHLLNAVSLLSLCLIENHQFFEAISLLERTVTDLSPNTPDHILLSLLYALSQAYEESGNASQSLYVLRKIEHTQKNYRDIQDRIQRLRKRMAWEP